MLAPDMATMLALCTTDAAVDPATLHKALQEAVAGSFNRISVDGATSTNDTVLVLASGQAATPSFDVLAAALQEACGSLAEQMVADAEGATKVAHVRVRGAAPRDEAAHVAARKVADSMLVQCSLFGEDPYWGRVVSRSWARPARRFRHRSRDHRLRGHGGVRRWGGGPLRRSGSERPHGG